MTTMRIATGRSCIRYETTKLVTAHEDRKRFRSALETSRRTVKYRRATYDRRHVVLGSWRDEHAQVRLSAVHAQVHWRGRLGLHVLVHTPRGHQQSRRVTVVSIAVS